jgi:hypothetical protein
MLSAQCSEKGLKMASIPVLGFGGRFGGAIFVGLDVDRKAFFPAF